jgi:hypothetical protein
MFRPTMTAGAAACLASALVLTGCGGSSGSSPGAASSGAGAAASKAPSQVQGLPADQVLAKAKQALSSAKTVHFTAKGKSSDGDISFDMRLATGPNATGTIGAAGQEIKVVRIGKVAYLSGNEQLLAGLSGGKAAAGTWVKMPADTPGLSSLLEISDLSSGMGTVLKAKGTLSLGTPKVVDGKQTVALVDSDPTGGGTLYVSAEGTPYPLLIEPASGSKDNASAKFTEYDVPVTVTPPPAADVVEVPAG